MPHLRIESNIPNDKIPADISEKLCKVVSTSLSKPISYCVATVIGDVKMSWGGTTEPAAQATLMSIGALGTEANKKHSKAIFEFVEKELGIPKDRLYIHYIDASTSNVGYNGTTFHEIFGN